MLLIRNADAILTLDPGRRILEHHSLLVDGAVIKDLGPAPEIDARHLAACDNGGTIVDARGRLVVPGYVNTHVHTFEHLSRGLIPDDSRRRLGGHVRAAVLRRAHGEEAYLGAKLACLDMLQSGTTCFVDVNILVSLGHLDAVAQAVTESGMRAVLGRGVFDRMPKEMVEAMAPALRQRVLFPSADAALREVDTLLGRWRTSATAAFARGRPVYGLAPYCSDELFAGLPGVARQHGVGMAFQHGVLDRGGEGRRSAPPVCGRSLISTGSACSGPTSC